MNPFTKRFRGNVADLAADTAAICPSRTAVRTSLTSAGGGRWEILGAGGKSGRMICVAMQITIGRPTSGSVPMSGRWVSLMLMRKPVYR